MLVHLPISSTTTLSSTVVSHLDCYRKVSDECYVCTSLINRKHEAIGPTMMLPLKRVSSCRFFLPADSTVVVALAHGMEIALHRRQTVYRRQDRYSTLRSGFLAVK
jgi:hypothetical protein